MYAGPSTRPGRQFDASGPGLGKDVPLLTTIQEWHPDTGNLNGPIVNCDPVSTAHDATCGVAGSTARMIRPKPTYRDCSLERQPAYAPGDLPTSSAVR